MDYLSIKELAKERGQRVTDFLALAPQNDPFYMGTPADIAAGKWFASIYYAAGYGTDNAPHLRRVHYWTVSQSPVIMMPNGLPYENTEKCWQTLIAASKAARYLEYVPLNGIRDNKNPDPYIGARYLSNDPSFELTIPSADFAPDFKMYGIHETTAQPYHLEIWCEKSTMNDVLAPLCDRYRANLVTFEGEVSITSVCVNLMRRIRESDYKPTRIFYISDFDPAGNSMPVAMSRKLEYALGADAFAYDVKVRPIALTTEQIRQYRLPRIPIKETEKRAATFEAAFGSGAVELDALEALHPGALARIVTDELSAYYSIAARDEAREKVNRLYTEIRQRWDAVTVKYQDQIDALKPLLDELRAITVDTREYQLERHDAEVLEYEGDWLYSSQRDYEDQIGYYREHKGR
ncbi:MAG: hypothetical protein SF123_09710 [Chloroflexota bacterium]|nr:hypothetical protein [Chloroflexota bacterium]